MGWRRGALVHARNGEDRDARRRQGCGTVSLHVTRAVDRRCEGESGRSHGAASACRRDADRGGVEIGATADRPGAPRPQRTLAGRITGSMSDHDDPPPTSRRRHLLRLAVVVAFLLGMFYLVAVARIVDVDAVRSAVAATGPAAPVAYVVVSALLGAVFVPGPILAAG